MLSNNIKFINSIDSTNDELRRCAEGGYADDCVLVSEEQTKGKGRKGRSFYSPGGTGIYISLLLHPNCTVEEAQSFTTMMAVAACIAIENVTEFETSIKWVNDIWIRGKKISGILTETSALITDGIPKFVISGIGINIFEPDGGFPDEIKDVAGTVYPSDTSLNENEKKKIKFDIAAELVRQFEKYYISDCDTKPAADRLIPSYLDEYKKRLFIIGRDVELLSPDHTSLNKTAHVIGINERCHLHVRYEDGTEEILSNGEISVKI